MCSFASNSPACLIFRKEKINIDLAIFPSHDTLGESLPNKGGEMVVVRGKRPVPCSIITPKTIYQ